MLLPFFNVAKYHLGKVILELMQPAVFSIDSNGLAMLISFT